MILNSGSLSRKQLPVTEEQFDYLVTKDQKVLIYWHNKLVTTLAGAQAKKFLRQITDENEQLIMARFTGNFKRGNERQGKNNQ